jgi:hypothetical protein
MDILLSSSGSLGLDLLLFVAGVGGKGQDVSPSTPFATYFMYDHVVDLKILACLTKPGSPSIISM